jgi:hypothetical protein
MSVFKSDNECKRMIFNVNCELAQRLELAREQARSFGKKLDVDSAVNKALEKFIKKAEKKIMDLQREGHGKALSEAEAEEALGADEAGE